MKRKIIFMFSLFCLSIGVAFSQTRITGSVVDENGEPVIGASILVKGTTMGTVTDIDGNFTLTVPPDGKTLVVSYVGMKTQEVPVAPHVGGDASCNGTS